MYSPQGPFEKADNEFRKNRDENLWIACLANSNQDVAVAKSQYIKYVAKLYIEEDKKREKEEESRKEKLKERARKEAIDADQRHKQWEQEHQAAIEAEALTKNELRFFRPIVGALIFALLGFISSILAFRVGNGFSLALPIILSIIHAHVGFVLWRKLRGFFIPEYKRVYGDFYIISPKLFIASSLICFLVLIVVIF